MCPVLQANPVRRHLERPVGDRSDLIATKNWPLQNNEVGFPASQVSRFAGLGRGTEAHAAEDQAIDVIEFVGSAE